MTTPAEEQLERDRQELLRAQGSRERANAAGDTDAVSAIDGYISELQTSIGTIESKDRDPNLYYGASGAELSDVEREGRIGALEKQRLALGPTTSEQEGRTLGGLFQSEDPEIFESTRIAEMKRQEAEMGGALNPLTPREMGAMSEVQAFERDEALPDAPATATPQWRMNNPMGTEGFLKPGDRLVVDPETGETRKAATSPITLAERRVTERRKTDSDAMIKTGTQQMIANRLRSEDAHIESRKLTQLTIFEQLGDQEKKRLEERFKGKEIADVSPALFMEAVEENDENKEILEGISGDESWEVFKERWKRIGNKALGVFSALPPEADEALNVFGADDPHGDVYGIETNLGMKYEDGEKAPLYPGASEHMSEYMNEVGSLHVYENLIQPFFKAEDEEGKVTLPGDRLSNYVEKVRAEQYSPEALKKKEKRFTAEDADWYNPFSWADGTTAMPWDDFDAFMIHVFENTPQIATGILSARMGGRGGAGLAGWVHKGQRLSRIETMRRRAAGVGGIAGGGGSEGLLIHDAVKDQITQGMNELDNEAFENSPYYLALIEAGMPDETARQILTSETSRLGGKTAFVASGLLMGAPMSYAFGRAAAGRIGSQLNKQGALRTGARIGAGGIGESIQEGSQEVSEDVITNFGMRAVDPDRPIFDDTLNTFMGGALISFGPGAAGSIARSDPAGLTKEDKQVMDATQDYMEATNRRFAFEAEVTSPEYIKNASAQQRLLDLKQLERLQEKEAKQLLANQSVMRDYLQAKGGRTAETELMMLDRLVARANATKNDIAVARSRRTTATEALAQYKREQAERRYIQKQIDDQVMEIHDVARLANNIDKIQMGEALDSEPEYEELIKQGWAKRTTEGEVVILPKGSRALNHLTQQHDSLINKLEKGYTGVDRRVEGNQELREKMNKMTEDEFEQAVYRRQITGLQSRRAMNERLEKDPDAKHFAFADVDTLSWINDNMGHNAGDRMLMNLGEAFLEEDGKNGIHVYHVSGDEFVVSGRTDKDVEAVMKRVRDKFASKKIKAGMDQVTPAITWGKGETVDQADAENNRMAELRQMQGQRAKKGSKPISHKDIGSTQGVLLHGEGRQQQGDQQEMFDKEEVTEWADVRRVIDIGDEIEIITPDNRSVTGTVSMVSLNRGRDRVKVYAEGYEFTFNPVKNWLITPHDPRALRDLSPQAAINSAMPGTQPNVATDVMIGRIGREGLWYADLSAVSVPYQYPGPQWSPPQQIAPRMPRATKKKVAKAKQIARRMFLRYKNLPRINIWASWEDIPDELQEAIYKEGGTATSARGWFDHDKPARGVHIILPNALGATDRSTKGLSEDELIERAVGVTLFHEIIGHYGIRGLVGNEPDLRLMMHQLVDSLTQGQRKSMYSLLGLSKYNTASKRFEEPLHPQNRPEWKQWTEQQQRLEIQKFEAEKQLVGEEFIAYAVGENYDKLGNLELTPKTQNIVKRFFQWLKEWLIGKGYGDYFHNPATSVLNKAKRNERITDRDIAALVARAQDFVRYESEWKFTTLGGDTSTLVGHDMNLMRDGDIFQSGIITAIEQGESEVLIWRTEKKDHVIKNKPDGTPNRGEFKRLKKQIPNGVEVIETIPIFPAEGTIAEFKKSIEMAVAEGYVTKNEIKVQRINAFLDNLSHGDLATYLPRNSRDPWWINQMEPVREKVMTAAKVAEWTDNAVAPEDIDAILPEDKRMSYDEALKILLSQPDPVRWINQGDAIEHVFGGKDYSDVTAGDIEQLKALPSVLRRAYEQAQEKVLADTKVGKRTKVPREALTAYMNGEKVIRVSFKTLNDKQGGNFNDIAREVLGEDKLLEIMRSSSYENPDKWAEEGHITEDEVKAIKDERAATIARGHDIGYNEQNAEWYDVSPRAAAHTGYLPHYNAAVPDSARNYAIFMEGRGPLYARDTSHSDHLSHHSFSSSDIPDRGSTVGHMRTTLMYDGDAEPPTAPNPDHQGHMWYLGELQGDWFQYISQAFNSPQEQAIGSSRIAGNFTTLIGRTRALSNVMAQKVKVEMNRILTQPLSTEQQEEVLTLMSGYFNRWDATGEEEVKLRLQLATEEGNRDAELAAIIDEHPAGKAFKLSLRAKEVAEKIKKARQRLVELMANKYPPVNVQSKQYVSDVRLHEVLDSGAMNRYLFGIDSQFKFVQRELEFAGRNDNAAEVAEHLNKATKKLENWPKEVADDLLRRNSFSTYQTRIPSLLPMVQDAFMEVVEAGGFDTKGLDDLAAHLSKTGTQIVALPATILDDNGIPTTGARGVDPVEFFTEMAGQNVAAGGNPDIDISASYNSDSNIVLNVSGPLGDLDAAVAFLPKLIEHHVANGVADKWRDNEQKRIKDAVRQSHEGAWRDNDDITWEEIEQFARLQAVNLENPDSWDDLERWAVERYKIPSKDEYVEKMITRRVENAIYEFTDRVNARPIEDFTMDDGRTLSRELPEYTSRITADGVNNDAEAWLRMEHRDAKKRMIDAAQKPGGEVHNNERKFLEKTYDEDPPGLIMGRLPGKVSEPEPGFAHGNIETEIPIFMQKKAPGSFWKLYIGKSVPEYHTEQEDIRDIHRRMPYWISEHITYYARRDEFPAVHDAGDEAGKTNYFKRFPNPFFDQNKVLTFDQVPKNPEPNWAELGSNISSKMSPPSDTEEHGESQFLFEEALRLNKKLHRGDWIPGMPMSDEDVRALFLQGILADAVRRGVPRVGWSGGLASTKRGGNWDGRWTNVTKITWSREMMNVRGQDKEVIVLQGDAVGSNYFGGWDEPLVVDGSIQSLGTVLGYNERKAIMDQIKGVATPMRAGAVTPQESDLQISASSDNVNYYLTLSGSNEILHRASTEEEAQAKKAELFAEAQESGSWGSAAQTSGVPQSSVFGGEFLGSGVIHSDEFGTSPMRVLIGQSMSQLGGSDGGYIPTLDITTMNESGIDRYWWYQKGARLSYDQLTYKAWENVLKPFGAEIEEGSIITDEYDSPFSAMGETEVAYTPPDLVQQHGAIRVEAVAGQRQGFIVTGSTDLVLPQVYSTMAEANMAMRDFISQNTGQAQRAAKVFQITINDKMRAHFSRPQPFLHYDPYDDPVLKEAAEKIGSQLPKFRDRYNQWSKTWKNEAHQGVFDRFYGIKYALQRAEVWDDVDAENNPYIQARFTTSLDSVMKAVLEYGAPVWKEGITQTTGKGLLEILQPVLNDVETWALYMAGTRSKRLLLEGMSALTADDVELLKKVAKENFKGKTDNDRVLALLSHYTAMEDLSNSSKPTQKAASTALAELQPKSDPSPAKHLVQKIIDGGRERNWRPYQIKRMAELGDHFTQFKKVARDYAAFNSKVLDYAEEAGIINSETRPLWENADYIPFYRVQDDRLAGGLGKGVGIANQHQQIKRLGGAEDNVGDLMHNVMMNLTNLVDASMKNHAARMTVDALKESGIIQKKPMTLEQKMVSMSHVKKKLLERGLNPEAIPEDALEGFQKSFALTPPKGEGVLSILRDGKKEFYYTDDMLLYRSMASINMQQWGNWINIFRAPKRLLTTMVTLDPGFMVANFIRDSASAFVLSRDHFIPVLGAVRGFGQALVKDEAMRTMLSAGAAFESGYINAYDPAATHRLLKKAQRKPGFARTIIRSPKLAFEAYKALGSAVENSNRMAVYNAAIAAGKSKAQAAFEAKDLMDFSMGGDWPFIQFLIQTVPFMGARMQGLHRLGRGMHENPVAFATKGAMIMMAGLALWFAFRDDERYKELEEWDKDTYFHWWIGDTHYRLPKPFEVGAIFNTIPERIMEYMYSEENDAGQLLMKRFGFMMAETFNMNPTPQTLKPLMEMYFNYNMFQGRQIVSPYEEQRMAPEEYRYSTSPTWIELARSMPGAFDTASGKIRSPLHLQNLFTGYTATLGRYMIIASDAFLRNQIGYPEPPEWRTGDYPVMGRFFRGDEPRRTKYEEEVYNLIRKVTEVQGSMRFLDKTEQFDRLDQIEEDWEAYIDIAPSLEGIREDVQDINKEIMYIWMDEKMDPAEKRIRADGLQQEKNELFKEGWELRPGGQAGAGQRILEMEDVGFMLDQFGVDDETDARIRDTAPETAVLMQDIDTLGMKELERLVNSGGGN